MVYRGKIAAHLRPVPNPKIVAAYVTEMRIDLLRRNDDQTWPDDPRTLPAGNRINLDGIGFTALIEAFYGLVG